LKLYFAIVKLKKKESLKLDLSSATTFPVGRDTWVRKHLQCKFRSSVIFLLDFILIAYDVFVNFRHLKLKEKVKI